MVNAGGWGDALEQGAVVAERVLVKKGSARHLPLAGVATLMGGTAARSLLTLGGALVGGTAATLNESRAARLSAGAKRSNRHMLGDADGRVRCVSATAYVLTLLQ